MIDTKIKRLGDGQFSIHDADTGEPLAVSVKEGTGKYASFNTKWHPHIKQTYPHAADEFNSFPKNSSVEGASGDAGRMLETLIKGKQRTVAYKDAGVTPEGYHNHQIVDKETGDPIMSFRSPAYQKFNTANSRDYTNITPHIGQDGLTAGLKKFTEKGTGSLSRLADVAEHLQQYATGKGGPRFVGSQTHKNDARTKIYSTAVEDPHAAMTEYAKGAIKNHHEFNKTMASPNMMILDRPDGQTHIITKNGNKITHTSVTHSAPASAESWDHVF